MPFYYFPRRPNRKWAKVPLFLYTGPVYQVVDITNENRTGWAVPPLIPNGKYLRKSYITRNEERASFFAYTEAAKTKLHNEISAAYQKEKAKFEDFMKDFDWDDVTEEDKQIALRAEDLNPQWFCRENA